MKRTYDKYGNETTKPESAEDYFLLEIERLKGENEELKKTIFNLEKDRYKQIDIIIDSNTKSGKYELTIEESGIYISKIEEGKTND